MNTLSRRSMTGWLAAALLTACSGIPLTSLPRLAALQGELLQADPADFLLAIQTDERMLPPVDAVPMLDIEIQPREAGAFEPVMRQLPMRATRDSAPAGLPRAGAGRRWLVYSLAPESAAELMRIQAFFRQLQARRDSHGGGTLGIGIAQDGVAADDPRLAATRWQSWLQTSAKTGFFELWSGTLGDLKQQARASTESRRQ